MDLSYHIEELLYSNDCVIIPTIGGFIVNYAAASIDFVEQQLLPPQKVVSFNPKLVNNDGLLANHIAQKEHLTYKQATAKVEAFSRDIEERLFNNEIVHFERIGKLYFNADSKLEFVPASTNFLKDAYGLPALSCTPILRNKDYLTKNKNDEKVLPLASKNKAVGGLMSLVTRSRVIAVAAVLLFVFISPSIYNILFNPTEMNQNGSIANQEINDSTVENNKTNQQASIIPSLTVTNERLDTTVAQNSENNSVTDENIQDDALIVTENPNSQDYIIVLGAFGRKKNADRLAKKLEKDNYLPDVTQRNGLNRVGVQITCTPEELKEHLKFLQENYNKKAWVVE